MQGGTISGRSALASSAGEAPGGTASGAGDPPADAGIYRPCGDPPSAGAGGLSASGAASHGPAPGSSADPPSSGNVSSAAANAADPAAATTIALGSSAPIAGIGTFVTGGAIDPEVVTASVDSANSNQTESADGSSGRDRTAAGMVIRPLVSKPEPSFAELVDESSKADTATEAALHDIPRLPRPIIVASNSVVPPSRNRQANGKKDR
jgi:hypothetical protein